MAKELGEFSCHSSCHRLEDWSLYIIMVLLKMDLKNQGCKLELVTLYFMHILSHPILLIERTQKVVVDQPLTFKAKVRSSGYTENPRLIAHVNALPSVKIFLETKKT